MKTKRILVAMLLLVLVCAFFVACNDKAADEYVGVIKGDASRGWKPTADPDPNNPYDTYSEYTDYSKGSWNFDGTAIHICFTNSESLNNLFYNYSTNDFDKEKFKSIDESQPSTLDIIRKRVISHGYADKEVKEYNRGLRLELANPSKENALKYVDEFNQIKGIRYSYPELYGSWFLTSNDPFISEQQDSFERIKLFDAWETTTGSSSVTVGLVDSGINRNHTDLTDNISSKSCGDSPYLDNIPHGTLTAGIIGAVGNNGKGISGVCWDVEIASLKACVGAAHETVELVIAAIDYAKANNIKLLNYSGGFYEDEISPDKKPELKQAIDNYPGLIVVSAGNAGENIGTKKTYPHDFDCDNMLVVGASTNDDIRASYSNYSATKVDLFAPGSAYTTNNNGNYKNATGTSIAAPFVTGVAALLLSMEPNLTAAQLKARIMQNVDAVPALSNLCFSGGRLNAKKAVDAHGHDSLYTCNYSSNGVRRGHSVSCNYCDYTGTEAHEWNAVKVPNTAIVKYHICIKCRAKTEIVEIPNPSFLLSPSVLALINEQESAMSGDFEIEITKDVAIVKKNGKYYLMIACDDEGRRLADLSKILKR